MGIPLDVNNLKCFGHFSAETWFSILFTVLVEIVPPEVRSASIAIFLFLMNNVGGNLPLTVDPVTQATNLRSALYIFWPGSVALSKYCLQCRLCV